MKQLGASVLLTAVMIALPAMAQPYAAYTSKSVHLRAGPARDYPVIAILPTGFQVSVQGCLSSYSWCDVIAGPSRGWIYAANINYGYQGAYVPVLDYGPIIGIAVLGFIVGDYWSDHYHDRPWFRDREQWIHRPRTPQPAPPGVHRPQPPQRGEPGVQGPRPPRRDEPVAQHPQPPQRNEPGVHRPQAPKRDQPGTQRPQPPQRGEPRAPQPQAPQQGLPPSERP